MREIIIILAILITLPILLNFFAGYFKIKRFSFYDIKDPRNQSSMLSGIGQRAISAQKNSWEALIFLLCTLLIAFSSGVDHSIILESVFAFLIIRLFYIIFYLADWGISRAITWALGIFVCLWLILKSYMNIN